MEIINWTMMRGNSEKGKNSRGCGVKVQVSSVPAGLGATEKRCDVKGSTEKAHGSPDSGACHVKQPPNWTSKRKGREGNSF